MSQPDYSAELFSEGRKPVVLAAFALEEESFPISSIAGMTVEKVLIGIGKVSAAMNLTQAVLKYRPALVVNIGTAGSSYHAVGDIIVCHDFVDRDLANLDIAGVCAGLSVTPSALFSPQSLLKGQFSSDTFTADTGDNFVTEPDGVLGDVVDMEAFACASVCHKFCVPFVAVKYVTDIVGRNSVKQWNEKLAEARHGLSRFFTDK